MTPVQIIEEVRSEFASKRIDEDEAVRRIREVLDVTDVGALDILTDSRPYEQRYRPKGATEA